MLLSFYPHFIGADKLGLERCCDLLQAIELTVAKKAWTAIRFVLLQSSHGAVSPSKNKPLSSVAKKLDSFRIGETGKVLLVLFPFKEQKFDFKGFIHDIKPQ